MDGPANDITSHSVKQLHISGVPLNEEQEDYKNSELNIMWLNPKLDPEQEGLFPNNKKELFQNMVLGWVQKNTDLKFSINMWYNSKTSSSAALATTQTDFNPLLQENCQNVTFKDIWDLPYIQSHPLAFENQDIYFISDLVRMAVALRHGHHNNPSLPRYVFYSDLNIPPLSLSSLFTDKTRIRKFNPDQPLIGILKEYGFALPVNNAGDLRFPYENSFLALDSQHEIACQALDFAILDINRLRGEEFARQNYWANCTDSQRKTKSQIVFASFPDMMNYYKYLTGEYGICSPYQRGGDPNDMPKTLQGKKAKFPFPQELFSLTEAKMARKCLYAKFMLECEYIGYKFANKTSPSGLPVDAEGYVQSTNRELRVAPDGDLRALTIQVDKPISSFYR